MTTLRLSFSLLLLSVALPCQMPPGVSHPHSLNAVPWTFGSGSFTRLVTIAREHPLHEKDAIVVRGGNLAQIDGAGIFTFPSPIAEFPTAVSDVAVLAGAHPNDDDLDRLFVTDPTSGLVTLLWWIPSAETAQMQSFAMPPWQGATQLTTTADATGNDIVGVAPDGQTILRARFEAGVLTHVSAINIGRTVTGTALADDNGDGTPETCFLTDLGVHIYNVAAAHVRTVLAHHPGGVIAASGNRLAWLRRKADDSGHELVYVIGGAGIVNWPTITRNGNDFHPIGMRGNDVDKLGDRDLLITQDSTQEALSVQLDVDPLDPDTLLATTTVIPLTATPNASGAANVCVAATEDLDGDGYDDILATLNTGLLVAVVRGLAVRNGTAAAMASLIHPDTVFKQSGVAGFANGLHLRLHQGDLFGVFTHIEVQLYWQPSAGANVELQGQWNTMYTIDQSLPAPASHSIRIGMPPHYDPGGFFHLVAVFFYDDPTDGMVPGPSHLIAGFAGPTEASQTYLDAGRERLDLIKLDSASHTDVCHIKPGSNPTTPPTPPPPGRILLGGVVPTHSIHPLAGKPKPRMPQQQGTTIAANQ